MNEELQYIATHLDQYSFNTSKARALKRRLQLWTTLPENEKQQKAEEWKLLETFHWLFANNPFLEQNGYVTDGRRYGELNGDITGAAIGAYYDGAHQYLSDYTKGSHPNDQQTIYLTDQRLTAFCTEKLQESERGMQTVLDFNRAVRGTKRAQFEHVLRPYSFIKGKNRSSPNWKSILLIVAFYALLVAFMLRPDGILTALFNGRIGSWFELSDYWVQFELLMILFGILQIKRAVNTVCKGLYRIWTIHRFNKAEYSVTETEKTLVAEADPEGWFNDFAHCARKDRQYIEVTPGCTTNQLEVPKMLSGKPTDVVLNALVYPEKPWKRYNEKGEYATFFLLWLIADAALLYGVIAAYA